MSTGFDDNWPGRCPAPTPAADPWGQMTAQLAGQPLPELPAPPGRQHRPLVELEVRQRPTKTAQEPRKRRSRGPGITQARKTPVRAD